MSAALPLGELRPSALPKLKHCGYFTGDPVAGPAAERGTRLDVAFRAIIADESPDLSTFEEDDVAALMWSVECARLLAGEHALNSEEGDLHVDIPGMPKGGTSDLLCLGGGWSADLKTGEVRDYESQMAAYAIGWMLKIGVDTWTTYLLFADQRYVLPLRWTMESAEACVRDALGRRNTPGLPPIPNEYCGWCAHRLDCEARREQLGAHLPISATSPEWSKVESLTLARFVGFAAVVADWREDARAELVRRINDGEAPPAGCKYSPRKGSEKLPAHELSSLTVERVAVLCGDIGVEKARAAFAEEGKPFPTGAVYTTPGTMVLTVTRPAEVAAPRKSKKKEEPEF